MTLDSIGQFPLVMMTRGTDCHHHWSRSEPELNSFLPTASNQSPPICGGGGFVNRSSSRRLAPVKSSRKLSYQGSRPNYAVARAWEPTSAAAFETRQFVPIDRYGHLTTVEQQLSPRQRADPQHPLPWTPVVGGYQADSDRLQQAVRLKALMLLDAAGKDGIDEDQGSSVSSSSWAPYVRERTRSTGSWRCFGGGRVSTTAEESTSGVRGMTYNGSGSGCFLVDDYFRSDRATISDASLETTRRNLVNLWASKGDCDAHGPWTPEVTVNGKGKVTEDELVTRSSSFSYGSSSSSSSGRWNHSGPDLDGHLLAQLRQVRRRYDDLPVDVTSRKRRLKTASSSSSGVERDSPWPKTVGASTPDPGDPDNGHRAQESRMQDFPEPSSSILRSMLTERGRCYSMSAIEMRRQRRRLVHAAPHHHHLATPHLPAVGAGDFNASATALNHPVTADKQLVTLAKKNLLPVTARVTDLLGKTVDFAQSVPEFRRLSLADREALLASSCLRLLLLAMAEANLQFATTVVATASAADAASSPGGGGGVGGGGEDGVHPVDGKSSWRGDHRTQPEEALRTPTIQFVNSIQNFIRKCQVLDITSEEYLQMKIITLFQSGIGSVDCTQASNGVNSSSRQQLQDLVNRCHPNEKLRYSSLLLSLHTLYGVHGGMMRSLFCRHLDKTGGISTLINNSLSTS